MKKILLKILKAIIILLLIICILLLISFIYHNIMLKIEEKKLSIPGQMISVFDTNYHVYVEGNGEKTIILLPGLGTTSTIYEYKQLYSRLSDKYKIVIIEKPGYGYSSSTNRVRNLNNILEEYKEILTKLNIKGPYILMAHSAGGLEALNWLQKYPEDVEAIISLDITLPEQSIYASTYSNENPLSYALTDFIYIIGSRTGLTRLSFVRNMFIDKGTLTDFEYEQHKMLFYKNAFSKYTIEEYDGVFYSGNQIDENALNYNIPYIDFISKPLKELEIIYTMHTNFSNKFVNKKIIELPNAEHTMYRTDSEKIAYEIKEYLNKYF